MPRAVRCLFVLVVLLTWSGRSFAQHMRAAPAGEDTPLLVVESEFVEDEVGVRLVQRVQLEGYATLHTEHPEITLARGASEQEVLDRWTAVPPVYWAWPGAIHYADADGRTFLLWRVEDITLQVATDPSVTPIESPHLRAWEVAYANPRSLVTCYLLLKIGHSDEAAECMYRSPLQGLPEYADGGEPAGLRPRSWAVPIMVTGVAENPYFVHRLAEYAASAPPGLSADMISAINTVLSPLGPGEMARVIATACAERGAECSPVAAVVAADLLLSPRSPTPPCVALNELLDAARAGGFPVFEWDRARALRRCRVQLESAVLVSDVAP
jgi:hypothetical protein